jgi:quinol monooxygenase YgiN
LHLRAKPGRRHALLEALDRFEVIVALREQPGFLASSVLVPLEDDDRVLVEGSWSSPEHYERWRMTPAFDETLSMFRHLLAEEPEVSVYTTVDAIS